MEKGQICDIKIEDVSNEGAGIGKVNGMAVFVKGAVVGDTVKAELTKVKKNYAFARLSRILEESPDRVKPECPYYDKCGGCSLGNLSYEAQLRIKEKHVRDKLVRLAGLEEPMVRPIVGMDAPFRYRNKAQFTVSTDGIITRKGGIVEPVSEPKVGFKREKSHEVIDTLDCQLQSEAAMAAAQALRRFMQEDNITSFDPKWQKGLMRHMIVKTAVNTLEVMVIFVINGKGIPNAQKLVDMLDDAIYEAGFNLESVIINVNKSGDLKGPILGDECITIAGKPTITDNFSGLCFEISPLAFYQVNPVQMEKLYNIALDYAGLTGDETVLDLYCGVGTIGLLCADKAKQVIGIEAVKGAVVDANRNAVINGIVNARYICGKAEEELPKLLERSGFGDIEDAANEETAAVGRGTDVYIDRVDVAILDPPRSGCDKRLLEAVCEAGAKRIVYVSCDPATQARDIKYLIEKGYEFVEATPVDQFCHTMHAETVVLMSRKDK